MGDQRVFIIENDLFFTSRITETLKQIGLTSILAGTPGEISKLFQQSDISLVILDLSLNGVDTLTLLSRLKSDRATCHIPVIAFAEHSEKQLLEDARENGCDIVVTHRGLVKDLKDLVLAALPEPIV